MSTPYSNVPPIDPNLKTGPTRMMSGVGKLRPISLDVAYGEFATWLYVGTAGNVNITQWDGTTIILKNLAAGVCHPIFTVMISSSGTTATDLCWGS